MRIIALVPVKALAEAKSRLTPPFTGAERAAFVRASLAHVLDTLAVSGAIARTLVVTSDPIVRDDAIAHGAIPVADTAGNLNGALDLARRAAIADGADVVLVVHADVPRLLPVEIAAMTAALPTPPAAVLAPDHTGTGTNALLVAPPAALPFQFGVNSFARHRAAAEARGLAYTVYRAPGIAGDVDTPDDMLSVAGRQQAAAGRNESGGSR